jgi:fatty-acyl-CoA synthase
MESLPIGDLFDRVARGARDREAFVFSDAGVRWTYRDSLAHVQRLAKSLIGLGIERGDHVAVWATNRPEWVSLQLATAKIGAVLVAVDPAFGAHELAYTLEQSDATTLFLVERFRDSDHVALLGECCPELPGARPGHVASRRFPRLKRVALLDDHRAPGVFAWSDVLAASAGVTDHMLRRRQESVDPNDTVRLQYTSGTTGFPKGAELTHHSLVNNAYYAGECMRLTARDRVCVPVPFHHCFGSVLGTLATICRGATMVVPAEHFDAERTLAAVAAEHCTALHGLPAMFSAMLAQRRFREFDLSSLRTGIMTGAPCPLAVMRQVVDRMHAREITVAYGQTEAAAVITQTRTEDPIELRVSTVGRALPHVELRIADRESGREVARGQEGELWCRGYLVMRGYYKMPEVTAATIDRNGWLHTGDLATMDEHGYCRIIGPVRDLVRRGGENVYPREVEEMLRAHPKVQDAQVFGVPDAVLGEDLAAWVRLRDGETATIEEIRNFCRERMAPFKVPRYVRFVDEYPTTVTGKVQKFKMRDLMSDELKRHRPPIQSTPSAPS